MVVQCNVMVVQNIPGHQVQAQLGLAWLADVTSLKVQWSEIWTLAAVPKNMVVTGSNMKKFKCCLIVKLSPEYCWRAVILKNQNRGIFIVDNCFVKSDLR